MLASGGRAVFDGREGKGAAGPKPRSAVSFDRGEHTRFHVSHVGCVCVLFSCLLVAYKILTCLEIGVNGISCSGSVNIRRYVGVIFFMVLFRRDFRRILFFLFCLFVLRIPDSPVWYW